MIEHLHGPHSLPPYEVSLVPAYCPHASPSIFTSSPPSWRPGPHIPPRGALKVAPREHIALVGSMIATIALMAALEGTHGARDAAGTAQRSLGGNEHVGHVLRSGMHARLR
jgi:hypothetical protein